MQKIANYVPNYACAYSYNSVILSILTNE